MRSIEEAEITRGTKVLIRVDWNVPVVDGQVLDTSRIEASLKTIEFVLNKGGKVILMSHFGDGSTSIEPVAEAARKFFPDISFKFVRDPWNSSSESGKNSLDYLESGGVALLENLRFWAEKENDPIFAKSLAELGDIYVNEAFSASHRNHASIVCLPKLLPSFAGLHFLNEVENLSKAFDPEHPFLFILGGAKLETKLPLVNKFLDIADNIFIGGALAKPASETDLAQNQKIILPKGDLSALDASEETLALLQEKINEAKFVLWNGPLGKYEDGYDKGTKAVGQAIVSANVDAIIGGGDTENIIDELGIRNSKIFVSFAGGAMLDFLAKRTLPGIEALESQTTNQK